MSECNDTIAGTSRKLVKKWRAGLINSLEAMERLEDQIFVSDEWAYKDMMDTAAPNGILK